jgi:aspartate/methionine/tyrosine aminotransferase
LIEPVARCHQFVTFTTPPNLQRATAFGLAKDDAYFHDLGAGMQRSRDRLRAGLDRIGFGAVDCQGTYFISADFRPLLQRPRVRGFNGDDVEFCKKLTLEAGVTAIPVSAFYQNDPPRHFIRFSFCKKDETLDSAIERMEGYFAS